MKSHESKKNLRDALKLLRHRRQWLAFCGTQGGRQVFLRKLKLSKSARCSRCLMASNPFLPASPVLSLLVHQPFAQCSLGSKFKELKEDFSFEDFGDIHSCLMLSPCHEVIVVEHHRGFNPWEEKRKLLNFYSIFWYSLHDA